MSTKAALSGVLIVCAGIALSGIHMLQETRRVPVERLARNLEKQIAAKPDDLGARLNLARLYAMAYALKVTEFEALSSKGDDLEPWFGYDAPHMPGPVRSPQSREHHERARADLAKAIAAYADVVARAPSNAIARLGYAWSLDQAGEKQKAIAEYRKVVELAWPADRKEKAFWKDPATDEAARRLIQLLDPVADAKEIGALEEKAAELQSRGRMITPIAIPLDGALTRAPLAREARVLFDADGSGIRKRWTWITPDAGWLVHDPGGSGRITSALQWFGNVTFWLFWPNGYEAMAALDDDGDGELRGAELTHLAVWRDANQNGVSEPGEVKPAAAYRIAALACRYTAGDGVSIAAESSAGVTFMDGTTRATFDVLLRAVGPAVSVTPPNQ
jgi:tetratricopeptide (TPR) repeat protein